MELNYVDLFDRAARMAGSRAALVDDAGEISHARLASTADRVANALIARGFAPSTRFALLSPNCSAAMVGMIGGLKAGGAWCNINLRNAAATNIDILARGRCEALFFHSSTAGLVPEFQRGVSTLRFTICLDQELPGFDSLAALARAGERQLLGHPRIRQTDLSSLRYLMSAAAPFAVEKIAAAHEIFGPIICQSYGQTESGFPLTFMPTWAVTEALANPAHAGRLRSVGLPTANVSALEIMDEAGQLLPPGAVGEIVMQGPTAMHRYIDDPDATAAIQQHGWQHTGDLGYRDEDGFVYVSDRKRDLIITGGFNVFPLEVEQVLASHPAVQDCAVIGVPDEKWGEAVKAVVELVPGRRVEEAELVELCRKKLGSVMAPKSIEFIETLPRSAVGKVLKRELRERYWKGRASRI